MRTAYVALFAIFLASCVKHQDPPPKSIREAVSADARFFLVDSDLTIMSTLPKANQEGEPQYVDETAMLIKRLAQAIQAPAPDLPPTAKTITVLALRPNLDRLGNETSNSFLKATYSVSDLRQAHVDRLGAYGVLDLATEAYAPWPYALTDWCKLHNSAMNFCIIAGFGPRG